MRTTRLQTDHAITTPEPYYTVEHIYSYNTVKILIITSNESHTDLKFMFMLGDIKQLLYVFDSKCQLKIENKDFFKKGGVYGNNPQMGFTTSE